MNTMQYKIQLPDDYDMEQIVQRVNKNGKKTDGFEGLFFKAYLITRKSKSNKNEYAPLYVWKDSEGMNTFLFDGFYDNILNTFGWQTISIAIPYFIQLTQAFQQAKYVIEIERAIKSTEKMKALTYSMHPKDVVGTLFVYNPDTWKVVEFYFFIEYPQDYEKQHLYEILHISQ